MNGLVWLGSGVGLVLSALWLRTRLDYRISHRHLRILLFGICLRRVRLADIDYISKRAHTWAEHWENTWKPKHRLLVVHRRRGWPRDVIITPAYRYQFWSELEQAIDGRKDSPKTLAEGETGDHRSRRGSAKKVAGED